MEARTKRTEAIISCSPLGPCHGKCGDRIHSRSGIMTIRLIVMELGRFTRVARRRSLGPVCFHYCTGVRGMRAVVDHARKTPVIEPSFTMNSHGAARYAIVRERGFADVSPGRAVPVSGRRVLTVGILSGAFQPVAEALRSPAGLAGGVRLSLRAEDVARHRPAGLDAGGQRILCADCVGPSISSCRFRRFCFFRRRGCWCGAASF